MEWLSSLPHTWEGDIREPVFTLTFNGSSFGIYLVSVRQNVEIALVLGATAAMAVAISYLLFTAVISPKKHTTTTAYLIGYGVVLPFWILFPMYCIRAFDIRNKVFRFCMGTVPTLAMFRTLEAIYGFCPDHITQSWSRFALYYSSPFLALYDPKKEQFVPADHKVLMQKAIRHTQGVLVTGAIHSLYLHFPNAFIEFGQPFDHDDWYSFRTIFRFQTLWRNLCFAGFFQIYLSTCAFGLQLITIAVTGLQLEEMWVDPLSKSASPSDFWSRRWNLSVHTTLKRGVFQPVRRYASKYSALMATFIASGLFHEWLVWITFSPLEESEDCFNARCYQPTYGPATVFFLFQALLIGMEFGASAKLKGYTNVLPGQITALLVVCVGGSMAHWFSEGYVHSSFFLDSRLAFVLVKQID